MKNISFIATMLLTIMTVGCLDEQCESAIRRGDSVIEFSGVIQDAYFDESNRGTATFIFIDSSKELTDTYTMCCYAEKGDSIWKVKGSLKYYLQRGQERKVFYPECGVMTITDTGTFRNPNFTMDCGNRRKTSKLPIEL